MADATWPTPRAHARTPLSPGSTHNLQRGQQPIPDGQTCLHPASLNFCIPTIEPATIFPSAIARRRCCSLPGGRALGLGEAMGAVSGDNSHVQQLAGVDAHGINLLPQPPSNALPWRALEPFGCYKMEGPATTWQQLPAAFGGNFHQYFSMGDDETRPEAVVWVNYFGLREASRG